MAAQRGEVLLVETEGKGLDEHLVQLQSVHHLQGVEVPDDDVGLSGVRFNSNFGTCNCKKGAQFEFKSSTYLEAHVRLLAGGNVLASVAHLNH